MFPITIRDGARKQDFSGLTPPPFFLVLKGIHSKVCRPGGEFFSISRGNAMLLDPRNIRLPRLRESQIYFVIKSTGAATERLSSSRLAELWEALPSFRLAELSSASAMPLPTSAFRSKHKSFRIRLLFCT